MSAGAPRNVIVAKRDAARWASRCENLLIGDVYRFVANLRLRSGVTLCDLIEREREGS